VQVEALERSAERNNGVIQGAAEQFFADANASTKHNGEICFHDILLRVWINGSTPPSLCADHLLSSFGGGRSKSVRAFRTFAVISYWKFNRPGSGWV
jgi:hypothetical protein